LCSKTLSPRETVLQVVRSVSPSHANPLGILHGGYMLSWIVDAATINASRIARSYTLLACMEDMLFISPVRVGDTVIVTSWVEYIGRSSLELSIMVETENPVTGERRFTTYSSMTMVAVDETLRPRHVGICVEPRSRVEEELYERALDRRRARSSRIERRRELVKDTTPPKTLSREYSLTSYFIVNPEDSIAYNVLHAGRLLKTLDEITGIVAARYSGNIVVTGAVDATDFYSPIKVGEVVEIQAGLSYIGRRSLEVAAKVLVRNPLNWEARHAATSYFTFVSIGHDGRSIPVKPFEPLEGWQAEIMEEGAKRKKAREELIRRLKSSEFREWIEIIRSTLRSY